MLEQGEDGGFVRCGPEAVGWEEAEGSGDWVVSEGGGEEGPAEGGREGREEGEGGEV